MRLVSMARSAMAMETAIGYPKLVGVSWGSDQKQTYICSSQPETKTCKMFGVADKSHGYGGSTNWCPKTSFSV